MSLRYTLGLIDFMLAAAEVLCANRLGDEDRAADRQHCSGSVVIML